jgi:hypothetical protein
MKTSTHDQKQMKTSTPYLKACPFVSPLVAGLLLASATANADVVFQADFKGTGGGTGGANDLVTVGGTGVIHSDQTNTITYCTNANPFTPSGDNYLQVQKISGGGPWDPVDFTFASATNCWPAWQGEDILGTDGNYDIALNGAYDIFFRVDSSSSINDMSSFRTIQQYSWSDGDNGLGLVLNGQTGGYIILQIRNAGFQLGITPQAFANFTSSGNNLQYYAQYDEIDAYYNPGVPLTNGLPYHLAFSLDTDTNGLTTLGLYLKEGTGSIDSTLDRLGWATFNLLATNLSDKNTNLTDVCFTNQTWEFGATWAADGPFTNAVAQVRIYNSKPATFTALPGTVVALPQLLPPVISNGQITLSWTGSGALQWAPSVTGPWTLVSPQPASPYSEAVTSGKRFYRLQAQ